jgi:hypothetical protein
MAPRLDPTGKRALFEAPLSAPPDHLRPGTVREGRDAMFSAGPPESGTVLVDCSACGARSRVAIADLGLRLLTGSLVWPGRSRGWFVRCPACNHRTWCSIGFKS